MDILIHGKQNSETLIQSVEDVLEVLRLRYHIAGFHEIQLHVALLDAQGDEVELVDTKNQQVYRIFDVLSQGPVLRTGRRIYPELRLVVDNTNRTK